jgi:hypothetical protein
MSEEMTRTNQRASGRSPWRTIQGFAAEFGYHPSTVHRLLGAGMREAAAVGEGRLTRIHVGQALQWLRARTSSPLTQVVIVAEEIQ